MQIPEYIYHPGTPGATLRGGLPVPSVGGSITTMRLLNPTGSTQDANFISKMVGLPFKQGDMPSGDWPRLTVGADVNCPATFWGATTWPDGSLKWVGCMARIPASVPGGSSIDVTVKRGGALDTTPTRTTEDLTAADLKTVLTGILNLTGEWTASLNDGISTGPVVLLGNGPAGSLWRIGSEYRDGASVEHGQLYQHHFVAGLTNSGGGLAGLRYMGRAMQMWGDYSAVTPNRRTFTAELRSGASLIRAIQASQNTAGALGSTVDMAHYTSWYTCGASGEYDFIPGTQAAECVVNWEHDPEYLVTTGVLPRIDTAITGITLMPSVDYAAYCKGNFQTYDVGSATIQSEIGAMTRFGAIHLINQDAQSLRSVRVNGLAIAGAPYRFLDKINQSIIPCVEYQPTYAGMKAPSFNYRFNQGRLSQGSPLLTNPTDKTSLWRNAEDVTHRPGTSWYPYVVTGEPQYLDQVMESAAQSIMYLNTGLFELNTTYPVQTITTGASSTTRRLLMNGVTYQGVGWMTRTELPRMLAWSIRDIGHAAALYPDVCPRGTEQRLYFRQLLDENFDFILKYRDAMVAGGHPEWASEGHHFFQQAGSSMWANSHLCQVICHLADLYPTADAIEYRQHLSKLWEAFATSVDMACPAAYVCLIFEPEGRIRSVSEMTWSMYSPQMNCAFDAETDRVTIVGTRPWVPTEGDRFSFQAAYRPFAAAVDKEVFYAVNISGLSFQLAATRGGAPIDITNGTGSNASFLVGLQNYPAAFSLQGTNDPEAYFANIRAAVLAHRACGDAVPLAHAAIQAKMPLTSIPYGSNPKFAYEGASNTAGV